MPTLDRLEAEWLHSHPGYNITRGGAQAAIGQAFATASGSRPSHLFAIRAPEGRLAGVLSYLEPNQYPNRHDSFHLAWMGVEQDLQNQGYGLALLVALARLANRSQSTITLSPASPESKRFFARHGFRYLGWGQGFGGNSERHYVLPASGVASLAFTLHARLGVFAPTSKQVESGPTLPSPM
jgi:GNAT superfamily N-acetyltransferase